MVYLFIWIHNLKFKMTNLTETDNDVCNASNIATTSSEYFLNRLRPEKFRKGDDVEAFIQECEVFF